MRYTNPSELLEAAIVWAGGRHAKKGQTYSSGEPYVVHLRDVDAILVRFGFVDLQDPDILDLRLAGAFHDLLEDTDVTPEEILAWGRPNALRLVQAVTSEPGENRAIRVAATLPKIRAAGPHAVVLKTADRTGNRERSVPGSRHDLMYRREHPVFREALYLPGEPAEPLWRHLDGLQAASG